MSKKSTEISEEYQEEYQADPLMEDGDSLSDLDFDVKSEYKPDPLIPEGTYHGTVVEVKFIPAQYCIEWRFCLHDNDGVMSDGETPIDGAHVFYRNWLPKPGDESVMSKSGKNTKRQSKINMLQSFQESLGIDMSTPAIIAESLADHTWLGLEADLEVKVDEYEGRVRNTVNKVSTSKMF